MLTEKQIKQYKRMKGKPSPISGKHWTDEQRRNLIPIRKAQRHNRKGIVMTKEQKEKISKAMIGRKVTWGNKISNGLKGKPKSEEQKKKISHTRLSRYTKERLSEIGKNARKKVIFPVKDTTIEVKLQNFLKQLNIEYYPHQYMKEIEHSYQCDLFIPSLNLIIEADGDYWHNFPFGNDIDHIRTKELEQAGFNVLRLWERDIRVMDINSFKERLIMISQKEVIKNVIK